MKKRIRRKVFVRGAIQHVYQRAKDKGVVFYDSLDRLMYFTTASVMAAKYELTVLAVSIMFPHLHQAIAIRGRREMEKYIQDTSSVFARHYNRRYHRHGALFKPNYGSASKVGAKRIRETLAYIYNNHVEKGLCDKAEESRWSFIPYFHSNHPFSEPIDYLKPGKRLMRSIKIVDKHRAANMYLKYKDLNRIFCGLNDIETEQMIDYIIVKYMFIAFEAAIFFYNNYDDMLRSFNATTGSERDIPEEFIAVPDTYYEDILFLLKKSGFNLQTVYNLTQERKGQIAKSLLINSKARDHQIKKFLH